MGVLLMIGGKCSRLRAKPARYTDVGYILAGSVEMMIQGQPTLILHAGDSFLMPPRTPHNALDVGPETGMMLSTYIVEVGQPLATFTI